MFVVVNVVKAGSNLFKLFSVNMSSCFLLMGVPDLDGIVFSYLPLVNLLLLLLKVVKLKNRKLAQQIDKMLKLKIDKSVPNAEFCTDKFYPKAKFSDIEKEFWDDYVSEHRRTFGCHWSNAYRGVWSYNVENISPALFQNDKRKTTCYMKFHVEPKLIYNGILDSFFSLSTTFIRNYWVVDYHINKQILKESKTLSLSFDYLGRIWINLRAAFGIEGEGDFTENVDNIRIIIWILNKNILLCNLTVLDIDGKRCGYEDIRLWHKTPLAFTDLRLILIRYNCMLFDKMIIWDANAYTCD